MMSKLPKILVPAFSAGIRVVINFAGVQPAGGFWARRPENRREHSISKQAQPQQRGQEGPQGREGVPRWPAAIAVLLVGAAYAVLPESLRLGPHILLLGVVVVLLVLMLSARLRDRPRLTRLLALSLITVVTAAVVASVLLLVSLLLLRQEVVPPPTLLRDAVLVWIINVVTFAVWYWEIDGGGPAQRRKDAHESSDFLFPQMAQEEGKAASNWSPQFMDYLFLAFNHSTAFSPTDTAVLSRRAKVLTMTQATLSLLVVAVLVARAINAL